MVALLRSGPLIGNMTAEVPGASGLVGGRGERNKYFRVLVEKTGFVFIGFISSETTIFPLYFSLH